MGNGGLRAWGEKKRPCHHDRAACDKHYYYNYNYEWLFHWMVGVEFLQALFQVRELLAQH